MSDAIAALMRAFRGKLPARLTALTEAVQRAESGDAGAIAAARTLAHKLHGTAGSYGYMSVSAAAGKLESLLELSKPSWPEVESALEAIRVTVESETSDGD